MHVGELGASYTRGIERHAISCIKHFALNSIDSSRFLVDVQASTRVLHELYLPHFRDCVIAGAGSVMTAYNRVNGLWCSQNPELINRILKRRWGFIGLVVTDFIFGLRDGVAGLLAGLDLEMPFRMILQGSFADSFTSGPISREAIQARIDDAVRRQLRQQLRIPIGSYPTSLRGCAEHLALARDAARQGIVLLRNKPVANHCSEVLPLQHLSSLAVIGPLADAVNLGDRGSSDTRPPQGVVVTPLAGLRAARPELAIHHADGRSRDDAAALAACCDTAVLVLGLDWRLEGEHIHPSDIAPILRQVPPPDWLMASMVWPLAQPLWHRFTALLAWITGHGSLRQGGNFAAGDRTELCPPESQVMLIRAVAAFNPRTVVVLMGGGAILTSDWDDLVPGLLMLWYRVNRAAMPWPMCCWAWFHRPVGCPSRFLEIWLICPGLSPGLHRSGTTSGMATGVCNGITMWRLIHLDSVCRTAISCIVSSKFVCCSQMPAVGTLWNCTFLSRMLG